MLTLATAGIARKQRQNVARFSTPEAFDKYHDWLVRAAKYPFLDTSDTLQDAIVTYLQQEGEATAAAWFRETMTGPVEGRWLLAHGHIGAASNNMGQESYYRWMKRATNSRRNVSLHFFMAAFVTHCQDCSEEEYKLALKFVPDPEHPDKASTVCTPYSYPSLPLVSVKTWDKVQKMDFACIVSMRLTGASEAENALFYTWIHDVFNGWCDDNDVHPDSNATTSVRAVWRSMPPNKANNATRFREVVMPTSDYVRMSKDNHKDTWMTHIATQLNRFLNVCKDGYVKTDMKNMIRLSEKFVMCEALDKKWSKNVRHKCTCPNFMKKAECEHVVVLAMLIDPAGVIPPGKADIRLINQRKAMKRGRPSADGDSDSLEEARKKPPATKPRSVELASGELTDSDDEEVRFILLLE